MISSLSVTLWLITLFSRGVGGDWFRAASRSGPCLWSWRRSKWEDKVMSWGKTESLWVDMFFSSYRSLSHVCPPPLWIIGMWQYSCSVLLFLFWWWILVDLVVFSLLFCFFPLVPDLAVFAWRKSAKAFSGTGWTDSANRSLSFHHITTMFQFV